jgi:hypothetical protein
VGTGGTDRKGQRREDYQSRIQDKLVAYEAATLRGTEKGEIQVGPTAGNSLTRSKQANPFDQP